MDAIIPSAQIICRKVVMNSLNMMFENEVIKLSEDRYEWKNKK